MSAFFVDTSALAKRYLVEIGTTWTRSWTKSAAGNVIIIAELTSVEMFSLLNRRLREGSLTPSSMNRLQQLFLGHLQFEYLVVFSFSQIHVLARDLVNRYPLRALDAIQLASAVHAVSLLATPMTFVSAAAAEGFITDDPNLHP